MRIWAEFQNRYGVHLSSSFYVSSITDFVQDLGMMNNQSNCLNPVTLLCWGSRVTVFKFPNILTVRRECVFTVLSIEVLTSAQYVTYCIAPGVTIL